MPDPKPPGGVGGQAVFLASPGQKTKKRHKSALVFALESEYNKGKEKRKGENAVRQYLLPENGRFFKVNLHAHTVFSDGRQTPEEVKQIYLEKGYSAVAFTDHELMLDHSDLSDERFIALTGYEYGFDLSKKNPLSTLYEGELKTREHAEKVHLNLFSKDPHDVRMVCCDLQYIWGNARNYRDRAEYVGSPDYKRVYSLDGVNEVIRAARERNMLVVYNHPNWSMNTSAFYCGLENLTGLEIINGAAGVDSDMEEVPHVYQEMARAGQRIVCVGGDDNHAISDCGLAWTMVKAESLSYENLVAGIENGNCYASSGPEIKELFVEDGRVTVKTSEAVGIFLHTAGRRTGFRRRAPGGELINEATFPLDETDVTFRISVRDEAGRHAYSRYYYLDELKEKIVRSDAPQ